MQTPTLLNHSPKRLYTTHVGAIASHHNSIAINQSFSSFHHRSY
jgi:hypothetical protein